MNLLTKTFIWIAILLAPTANAETFSSEHYKLNLHKIATKLNHPWSIAVLPNGNLLVTERSGRLRLWSKGTLSKPISNVPAVARGGQGGLLDVILHPLFADNNIIYLSYSKPISTNRTTAVMRAHLDIDKLRLVNQKDIFIAQPALSSRRHYGSRMSFDNNQLLYISVGDRGFDESAQNLNNHLGSVIRLHDDGSIPKDNPFVGKSGFKAEVFSYGHRNPQGMTLHADGSIWIHEHGPMGGDEINKLLAGANYGWPTITHGKSYAGFSIGEGSSKAGMEQPLWHWTPSIAPSGMVDYRGKMFPKWLGNTLVGSLKFAYLERLVWKDNKVVAREQLIDKLIGRVRDVRVGAKGELYILNDESSGSIYLLTKSD